MVSPSKILRQIGESVLICIGLVLIPFFPRSCILSAAKCFGRMAFSRAKRLRRVTLANLELALGSSTDLSEREAIARESYSTFALLVLDLFWFSIFNRRRIAKYFKFDESFDNYFKARTPSVIVTAHFGNWELLGLAMAQAGDPCTGVAKALDNPFADLVFRRLRPDTAARGGAIRTAIRSLREGKKIALLLDQNTLPSEGGEFVEFFGRQVPNSKAVETLASRTSASVVFIYAMVNWLNGVYTGHASEELDLKNFTDKDGGITAKLTSMTEDLIRRHPGAWLWSYKRWKFVPPGEDEKRYPFYARKVDQTDNEKDSNHKEG